MSRDSQPSKPEFALRAGAPGDSLILAALSVQVFLDTYATEGVRPDLAREAFGGYSDQAFASRLAEQDRKFLLAHRGEALIGFAELRVAELPAPAGELLGAELVRLYVQPHAQRSGVGRALLYEAERLAITRNVSSLWLTVWERNERALAFYRRMGYADVGATTYSFEGNTYGNRVFAKPLLST
jgi:ribosomal protein S18 acetylase RimI-like enzyme